MVNHNNKHDLSISFRTISHFFNLDDPSPEHIRELSDRAEEEIAKSVTFFLKTVPHSDQGDLIISLPESDLNSPREIDLPSAVISHFQNRIQDLERDRSLIWWAGIREFRLTVAVLISALLGIWFFSSFFKDAVGEVVQNILIICCWVVVWQPFQTLVFDRWALAVRIRVYRHISRMSIRVCVKS